MAEGVIIEGLGGGMKGWATEHTLEKILTELQDIHKLSDKQVKAIEGSVRGAAGGGSSEALKDLDDALGDLAGTTEQSTTATKKTTKTTKKFDSSLKNAGKAVSTFTIGLGSQALGFLYSSITSSVDTINQLNSSGMSLYETQNGVTGQMTSLARVAKNTNLTFNQLNEMQQQYGSTLNRVGIGQFSKWSKNLRGQFQGLGIVSGEAAELMAGYLEGQAGFAFQQQRSASLQQKQIADSIQSMDKWSHILGVSRKQILESINAEKKKPEVAAFLATLTSESQAAFNELQNNFAATPQLLSSLSESLADPIAARSKIYTDLAKAGASDTAAIFLQLSNAMKNSPGDVAGLTAQFKDSLKSISTEQARLMGESGSTLLSIYAENNKLAQQEAKQVGKDRKKVEASQKKTLQQNAEYQDSVNALKVTTDTVSMLMQQSFLPMITKVTGAMNTLYESIFVKLEPYLSGFGNTIQNLIKNIDATNFDEVFGSIPKLLMLLVKDAGSALLSGLAALPMTILETVQEGIKNQDWGVVAAAMAAGVGTYLAAKTAVKKVAGLVPGLSGRADAGAPAGGGKGGGKAMNFKSLGNLGKQIGSFIASVGKGGGQAVQAILSGLAKGIAAFANPMVAAGAAVIGVSIAAIGAGIAGATALMGKSLPVMSAGMKSFEELDGERLQSVGMGIKDLGLGLAAMGASGVTNAFGNVADSVSSFFGGQTIFDKIEEFADGVIKLEAPMVRSGAILESYTSNISNLAIAFGQLNAVTSAVKIPELPAAPTEAASPLAPTSPNKTSKSTNAPSPEHTEINTVNKQILEKLERLIQISSDQHTTLKRVNKNTKQE